ncbi:MAG: hypothetical protein ACI8O8_002498 [Oleiphilaceae bacterium]|jgi:hypothetical protein
MTQGRFQHLLLPSNPESRNYTSTSSGGGDKNIIPRGREAHGSFLRRRFDAAWEESENESAVTHSARKGVYIEFESDPNAELLTKGLEEMRSKKVRLLNVRKVNEQQTLDGRVIEHEKTLATVYIANERKQHFVHKLEQYLTENTPRKDNPKNQPLINSIADIRKALLIDSFWCDDLSLIPAEESKWVEVWLSTDDINEVEEFEQLLNSLEIPTKTHQLIFPERTVKLICANKGKLEILSQRSDMIAEYKAAKTTADFFVGQPNSEQAEWVNDLENRTTVNTESNSSVCILDTGINYLHPLLAGVSREDYCLAHDMDWGVNDHHSHGTLMAGLTTYGCLEDALSTTADINIPFLLESVKILPPSPASNYPDIWGAITEQAVYKAITIDGRKNRTFCMAVTAKDTRDRGRPTSWSAALDQITFNKSLEQLFVVSVGNVTSDLTIAGQEYPNIQTTDSVHDPAQAWNVISVGAYTQKGTITDPNLNGYEPVAKNEQLSPFSTTSLEWEENKWPIKPELVLEGGNLAVDKASGFVTECDDLSLLSTWYEPTITQFNSFSMTSAATAKLANLCGHLRAEYPEYWEETIRALLIHSAEWPEGLKNQFLTSNSKTDFSNLLKICGYGVPNIERAKYSANNALNMIVQSEIQPFTKEGSELKTNEMHFYELPWPKEVLQELPLDTKVRMKITLSYFIEPGPGEIGWKDRYRYPSHGLRFEVNAPDEDKDNFVKRINQADREHKNDTSDSSGTADFWKYGKQARDRGSVHSDVWQGTAAQLAESNLIAITPTIGWWRERAYLEKWDSKARYSLVVSIETEDTAIDVYTPVAISIGIAPEVVIAV